MADTTTFGASIVPAAKTNYSDLPLPPPVLDSPALTPAVSHEDLSDEITEKRHIPPHSPFYQHPDHNASTTSSRVYVAANEKDLEGGPTTPLAPLADSKNPFTSKVSVDCNKECKMWPSKQTLMESRKEEKRRKREGLKKTCGPLVDRWGRQTKRQKLMIKILFGLFLVGVIVAVAVGITVAVNGTVYVSEGKSAKFPDPGDN